MGGTNGCLAPETDLSGSLGGELLVQESSDRVSEDDGGGRNFDAASEFLRQARAASDGGDESLCAACCEMIRIALRIERQFVSARQ